MAKVIAIPKLNTNDVILDATIGTSGKIYALVYNPTDKFRIDSTDGVNNNKFIKGASITGLSYGSIRL